MFPIHNYITFSQSNQQLDPFYATLLTRVAATHQTVLPAEIFAFAASFPSVASKLNNLAFRRFAHENTYRKGVTFTSTHTEHSLHPSNQLSKKDIKSVFFPRLVETDLKRMRRLAVSPPTVYSWGGCRY